MALRRRWQSKGPGKEKPRARLAKLYIDNNNNAGDAGLQALADALEAGELAALRALLI